jgi:hypothetical protein
MYVFAQSHYTRLMVSARSKHTLAVHTCILKKTAR